MLPSLAHFFGVRWEHIEVMPRRELDQYLQALADLLDLDGG